MYPKIKTSNILKLAFPEFATQLVIVIAAMLEMLNVAKLGIVAIAAVSIGNMVTVTINNFLGEVDMGSRVLAARFLGARDYSSLLKTFAISISVPIIVGLIIVLLDRQISFIAFYLIGDSSLNQIGAMYLTTTLKSVPFALTFFSLNGFLAGLGDTLSSFYIRLIMHSFEVCFGYILMFGHLGFPKLGVQGVATAVIFTYILGTSLCMIVILYKKLVNYNIRFNLFKDLLVDNANILKSYLKLSFDLGLQFGLSDIALYLFIIIVGWHGVNTLAVYQIAYCQVFSSMQLPLYGFYTAASIIVGQALGEKKFLWVMPATSKILKIAVFLSIIMGTITFLLSSFISQIFSPLDTSVAIMSALSIKVLSLNIVLETFYIVISGSLIGACESHFVMELGLTIEYLFLLPVCYILSLKLGLGFVGACTALCFRSAINCLIVGCRFFVFRKWDTPKVTFRKHKIFGIQPATKNIPSYGLENEILIANSFLDDGIVAPVTFFEKNSERKIS